MGKGIAAADLEIGAAVNHAHIDGVDDAKVEFAAVEQRHERAGAGVGLHLRLDRRRIADDFRQAARQGVEQRAWRVGADGDGFG